MRSMSAIAIRRSSTSSKQDPTGWKGHVGDVSNVVRVAITGRKNSPDLWSIMTLLGKERSLSRLRKMKEFLAK